jgi:hypothetical protein
VASLIHPPRVGCLGAAPGRRAPGGAATLPAPRAPAAPVDHIAPRRAALSAADPNYNPETDTYRQIYRGHDNASAVTNSEGLTVFFDPDTNEVLGFSIANFRAYYEAHVTDDGEFEVSLPAKVPVNLEEEMDFDAEAIRSCVRIAEFY